MSVDICLYSVGEAHEWMCMYEYNICDILIYNNNSDMERRGLGACQNLRFSYIASINLPEIERSWFRCFLTFLSWYL